MSALSPETTLPFGLDKVRELESRLIKGARLAAYCILHTARHIHKCCIRCLEDLIQLYFILEPRLRRRHRIYLEDKKSDCSQLCGHT